VIQTSLGYLITYSLATDPNSRVYTPHIESGHSSASRYRSASGSRSHSGGERILWGAGDDGGVREVSVRFKMVIKVDAGIERALALDEELVVATEKPAAVQCIRWTPDSSGNQTSTELLSRMGWMSKKATVSDMVHDRPMNLSTWITNDGRAYAVQRLSGASQDMDDPRKLFKGYCFHIPENEEEYAMKASINARFSLIAIGCTNGTVLIYSVRDYAGNIPLSYKLKPTVSLSSSGRINSLSYSPDGYCLFAGFEKGWITWSVYGKPGGTSFTSDRHTSKSNGEEWLDGIREASWLAGGTEVLLVAQNDDRLWLLEMARSAVAGCFSAANISRSLLQTNSGFMVYRGYDQPDLTTISAESSLWHHVQIPTVYLVSQWPVRQAVISPDGRYVAVAGRRGLAHYSVNSGRWKTFVNENMENEFVVRGGMCWYQHILIAAVESGDHCEVRSDI
jgi:WD40 repeat protein